MRCLRRSARRAVRRSTSHARSTAKSTWMRSSGSSWLSLEYRVAQVCNAYALDHGRVAKADWRAGEAVEESNTSPKKNRRDIDGDFVEEPSIQALLDDVGAVDANRLPGGGSFGLAHGAFDA